MKGWRLIPLETRNGYCNMALDEAILNAVIQKKSPNTIRFYKWYPSTASIGRNQSLTHEIDLEFAKRRGYNIVRRITGGGAVFHDNSGEITYSIICPIKSLENLGAYSVLEQFEIITECIMKGLTNFGLTSQKGIIHCPAIFLDGKKFSGNAQIRKKGFLLQHGTILLEIDSELMYSVLKAPENIGKSRMIRSVRAKCIGIKEKLNNYNEEKFIDALKLGFVETLRIEIIEEDPFTDDEIESAKKLANDKYGNDEWLKKYE